MASSKLRVNLEKKTLYCAVRQTWVAAQPEEWVRQRIVHHMVDALGYPLGIIAVEKALRSLPHLENTDLSLIPDRRADIICLRQGRPLLLLECKAVPLNDQVLRQVWGYNYSIKAPYVAIANEQEVRTCWYDPQTGDYRVVPYLPTYQDIKPNFLPVPTRVPGNCLEK